MRHTTIFYKFCKKRINIMFEKSELKELYTRQDYTFEVRQK